MTVRQEVNLYLPGLRPKRDYLTPPKVGAGLGLLLVFLLVLGAWQFVQSRQLEERVADRQQRVDELQSQVNAVRQNLPQGRSAALDAEIAELRRQVRRREAINTLIEGREMGNTDGFSEQMLGFSKAVGDQLYLTGFQLQRGGEKIILSGQAREAQAVPLYVARLRELSGFRNSSFGRLQIERSDESELLKFNLNRMDSGG